MTSISTLYKLINAGGGRDHLWNIYALLPQYVCLRDRIPSHGKPRYIQPSVIDQFLAKGFMFLDKLMLSMLCYLKLSILATDSL